MSLSCNSTPNKSLNVTVLHVSLSIRMPTARHLLLLAFLSCCAVVSASSSVVINEGDSLKSLLCGNENGTQLADTTILLNQSHLYLNYEEGSDSTVCLIENTHDVAIIPSQQVLDKYVTVHCNTPTAFGFAFLNVRNLTIRSVVFQDCRAAVLSYVVKWVNQTDQMLYYGKDISFTLFFSHCYDLRLQNISVGFYVDNLDFNDNFDLLGVNLCGMTEIENILPAENQDKYPLLTMFIYFTDTKQVNSTECNLKIRSNTIDAVYPDITDFFNVAGIRLPVYPFADFSMLLTQSFAVNVSLVLSHNSSTNVYYFPVNIFIAFINSIGSSSVTFEGYNTPYQACLAHKDSVDPYYRPLMLRVAYLETPSFRNHQNVTPALLIRNTAFIGLTDVLVHYTEPPLKIEKFTNKLSHQVRLENISWCYNELSMFTSKDYLNVRPFQLFSVHHWAPSEESQLHLNISNLLAHHNRFDIDGDVLKSCLMCFLNVTNIVMTGTNNFSNNFGAAVIDAQQQSSLWISGQLIVKHGSSFRGGGIYLDQTAMLYLQEPLLAEFHNNTADLGSAIYAPIHTTRVSAIQIVPTRPYSLANVKSINITLQFDGNIENGKPKSFYAPHFSLFGEQTSSNLLFSKTTWDNRRKLYAYTVLIDAVLHMKEKADKYMSLST